MFSGRFVLFGTHDMRTVNTVRSYTNKFHMPYVTSSMPVNVTGQNNGYILYMRPLYTQAIIDIIRHYRWTRVFYLFNNEDGECHIGGKGMGSFSCEFNWKVHIWYLDVPTLLIVFEPKHSMMTSSNGNIFRVTGIWAGNSPVPGEFTALRPVTRSFDVFFDLRLSKQSWGWWFQTLSRPLWCHRNALTIQSLND